VYVFFLFLTANILIKTNPLMVSREEHRQYKAEATPPTQQQKTISGRRLLEKRHTGKTEQ